MSERRYIVGGPSQRSQSPNVRISASPSVGRPWSLLNPWSLSSLLSLLSLTVSLVCVGRLGLFVPHSQKVSPLHLGALLGSPKRRTKLWLRKHRRRLSYTQDQVHNLTINSDSNNRWRAIHDLPLQPHSLRKALASRQMNIPLMTTTQMTVKKRRRVLR